MDIQTIGATDLQVAPLGVGTWAWGDQMVWGYGKGYSRSDVADAFQTSLEAGITLFDTAEIYGQGASERILGELVRQSGARVSIATKFAPLPWRLEPANLRQALDQSLARLGVSQIDLYQIHWPYSLLQIPALMDALADAVAEGKLRAVGVSNYSAAQMRRAHAALARRGVPLASNQIEYSLLHRAPETNGVLAACRELGVTPIAYSPLAMGLLTGKYRPGAPPSGARRLSPNFSPRSLAAVQPVLVLAQKISNEQGGKSIAQVALRWLIQRGALPIPGAKNARQAKQNAGALGWQLTPAQIAALDEATHQWL